MALAEGLGQVRQGKAWLGSRGLASRGRLGLGVFRFGSFGLSGRGSARYVLFGRGKLWL